MKYDFNNAFDADAKLPRPRAGEVWSYARKSNVPKHGGSYDGSVKSIADQNKVNFRTAERFSLTLLEECVINEKPGYSGDVWWEGVSFGCGTDEAREFRPEFTRLKDLILSGRCKAVITYAQCRLFRDVGIASAFMDLCCQHGVRVYDSNGLLDIWSSDGRAHVRFLANNNQYHREKSGKDTLRGLEECWQRNEMVVVAGKLGFRSCGFRTKQVRAIPEELNWVRWIFRAFTEGVDARGPLTINDIARALSADTHFIWAEDLIDRRGKRSEATRGVVYPWQVRHLLRDERYVGKQRRDGRVTDCPAFLVNGEPAIPHEVFELAQRKLNSHRGRPRGSGRDQHMFSGQVRCGLCGRLLTVARGTVRGKGAKVWKRYAPTGYMTCRHGLPPIPYEELNRYFVGVLAPLIRVELEARESEASFAAALARQDTLKQEKRELEAWIELELPRYAAEVSPTLAANMEKVKLQRLVEIETDLAELEESASADSALRHHLLRDIEELPPRLLIDLAQLLIQWIAVIPQVAASHDLRQGPRPAHGVIGVLLFCTSIGTYHTAEIRVEAHKDRRRKDVRLVQADEETLVGSVNELQHPDLFLAELLRTAISAGAECDLRVAAPGADDSLIEAAERLSKEPRAAA